MPMTKITDVYRAVASSSDRHSHSSHKMTPSPTERVRRRLSTRSKRSFGAICLEEEADAECTQVPGNHPINGVQVENGTMPKKQRLFEKTKICAEMKHSLSSNALQRAPRNITSCSTRATCAKLLNHAAPLTVISPCPWLKHSQPGTKTRRASVPSVLPSRASRAPQSTWRNCSGNTGRRRRSCPSIPPYLELPEASISHQESKARPERMMNTRKFFSLRSGASAAASLRTVGKPRLCVPEAVAMGLRECGETSCDSDDTDDDEEEDDSDASDSEDDEAKQEKEKVKANDDETLVVTQRLAGRGKMVMRQRMERSCVTEWRLDVDQLAINESRKRSSRVSADWSGSLSKTKERGHMVIVGVQLADQKGSYTVYSNERGMVFRNREYVKRGLKIKKGSQIVVRASYDEMEKRVRVNFVYYLQGKAVQIDTTPIVIDNLKPFGCGLLAKVFVAQNERAQNGTYTLSRITHTLAASVQ